MKRGHTGEEMAPNFLFRPIPGKPTKSVPSSDMQQDQHATK